MSSTNDLKRSTWHDHVFFGLHFDLHPGANDTELGAQTTYAHIRAELAKVKPDWVMYDCKGVPGYAGYPTRVGLPSPGIVKDALKVWRKVTRDMGIPLSVHYCGLWDDERWRRQPDWAALKPDGNRYGENAFDGWHSHPMSVDGPYGEQVLIPQLLEVIDDYDVDGVWVDADAWVTVPDWRDETRALFVEVMRQQAGHEDFSAESVPVKPEDPFWHDYLAFNRQRYAAYLTRYANALHARKSTFAVCSNWAYSARMPEEITTPVDYLSGDYTWKFAADSIALEAKVFDSRGIPWDLMGWGFTTSGSMSEAQWTTRSAAELQMEGALVMSNGGAFWIYDTPVRNGRLVDWHMDTFAEVGKFLRARRQVFQNTVSAPHVALLHSQSHYYSHYPQTLSALHHGAQPLRTLTGALQLLTQNHYHTDVLNEETLLRRLDEYSVVAVTEQTHIPAEMKNALLAWVRRGGRLLLTGSHVASEYAAELGVEVVGAPTTQQVYVAAQGGAVPLFGEWQYVKPRSAKVLAPLLRSQDVKHGKLPYPAATIRKYGKGSIGAVYGPVAALYADYRYPRTLGFMREVLQALTGAMPVECDAPTWVQMIVRQREGQLIVHLVNTASTNPLSPNAPLMEGIAAACPITVKITCARRPRQVTITPDDGGLTWKWRSGVLTATLDALHIHTALVISL